jgi:hypothetical protein
MAGRRDRVLHAATRMRCAAVRGAALSMTSIPAAQGQEPVSPDLPGERARGLDGGVEHAREILPPERRFVLHPIATG